MSAALLHRLPAGPVVLLADRAAYLPEQGLLLVADAHLGKAQAFRRLGVPVPSGTTAHNLVRLQALVAQTGTREIVFLGDLLHARQSRHADLDAAFVAWRQAHPQLGLRLIRGNHDRHAGDPPAAWGVQVTDEPWRCGPWAFCHHPAEVKGAYAFAGHVHPAVRVGRGAGALRLPCFHLGSTLMLLPAFGAFTGLHIVQPAPGDSVAVVAEDAVRWAVPPSGLSLAGGP